MDRDKLGLKIVRVSQGYGEGLEVNASDVWTRYVHDVRDDLKLIDGLEDNSVLMLTTLNDGNLLTIASYIAGRGEDLRSAWIFVPSDVSISGKALAEVIELTKKEILAVECNEDLLKSLYNRSYDIAPAKRISQRSNSGQFAYRRYGRGCNYTLLELLNDIHQPYYNDYKYVFFIDNFAQLQCPAGVDLSNQFLYSSILAKAPKTVDGFIPYVNGKYFNSPMYVSVGDTIKITWKKEGYEQITTNTIVKEGFNYVEPTVNQYMRLIPYNAIQVVDEWKRPIVNYSLYINHREVAPNGFASVNEAALDDVRVDVKADGYESKGGTVNFRQGGAFTIRLAQTSYEYKLLIPLKDRDNYIELGAIQTHHSLKKSPIEGYVSADGTYYKNNRTYMRYAPYNKAFWIKAAIVIFIVFICGLGLGFWAMDHFNDKEVADLNKVIKELKEEKGTSKGNHSYGTRNQETKGTTDQGGNIKEIVKYLDSNNVWNRQKMEKYPEIKGLWDAINERNFTKILIFEDTLKDSKTFQKVLEAVIRNRDKSFSGNYNPVGDYDITIDSQGRNKGYIKSLDDALKSSVKPAAQEPSNGNPDQKNKKVGNDNW